MIAMMWTWLLKCLANVWSDNRVMMSEPFARYHKLKLSWPREVLAAGTDRTGEAMSIETMRLMSWSILLKAHH